jgi:catechol 2,3-dioxygenase-like lactoylglutathione lyase family enzyme
MTDRQFRFAYFARAYEESVAFYRDGLGMSVAHSWDRSSDDRGTLIRAGAGLIEVLAMPSGPSDHLFDSRPPQGVFAVVEVENVDELYRRALEAKIPIQQGLDDQSWGHRCFCVREPNGLTVYLFSSLPNSRW